MFGSTLSLEASRVLGFRGLVVSGFLGFFRVFSGFLGVFRGVWGLWVDGFVAQWFRGLWPRDSGAGDSWKGGPGSRRKAVVLAIAPTQHTPRGV